MALFFFLIGIEVRTEIREGELSSLRLAALPIAAAIGGMIVPAIAYITLNAGTPALRGWAIPIATDIAFALGVLALLRKREPKGARPFLAALAIIDDIGAIAVIAIFYTATISPPALIAATLTLGLLLLLTRVGVESLIPYTLLGLGLWIAILYSGIHTTIAGVLLAFAIPGRSGAEGGPAARAESLLERPVAFLVLPLFALANAGVQIRGAGGDPQTTKVLLGTTIGLLIGKPVGIVAAAALALRLGAERPGEIEGRSILGASFLAGIGFTMSIFIAGLAFEQRTHLSAAKLGILAAAPIAAIAGYLTLRR